MKLPDIKTIRSKIKTCLKRRKNSRCLLISILIFLLFILLSITAFYLYNKQSGTKLSQLISSPSPPSIPSPTPTPSPSPRAIPHGKIGFSVSQADKTKPQFRMGYIDPYDPAQGSKQTVTIHVKDEQPITEVTAILKTDNTVSEPYSFQLISGSATDGQWQGSWIVNDTYLYTYSLILKATSSRGQSIVESVLR